MGGSPITTAPSATHLSWSSAPPALCSKETASRMHEAKTENGGGESHKVAPYDVKSCSPEAFGVGAKEASSPAALSVSTMDETLAVVDACSTTTVCVGTITFTARTPGRPSRMA